MQTLPSEAEPAPVPQAEDLVPGPTPRMGAERRRLSLALLLSLLMHALLLGLTFGGQGLGLPGFGLPWQERRIEAPDLRLVLVPARVTAVEPGGRAVRQPLPPAPIEPPVAGGLAVTPAVSPAPAVGRPVEAIVADAKRPPSANATAEPKPKPDDATDVPPARAPLRAETSGDAAPTPIPEPAVIAMDRPDETTFTVPAAPPVPTPVTAAAPSASSSEASAPTPRDAVDAARERAAELASLEASKAEAHRQAAQLEAARIEAARREAERQEVVRKEAVRQEAARQEAARQELERVETARLEAERQEAARQVAVRKEEARKEAARQEAVRQEAPRLDAAQEEAARREAARRAMGRQLDEEAARREAASTAAGSPSRPVPASSGVRRGRLFGRTDPNAELVLYAEAWARKIQLNMTFDMVREAAKRPHVDPLVTVAIRSDGSVESVTFVTPSGVAEIDDAIRRIVQGQASYPAFPPALAREFDVIEIRRTWHFDMAIRLY